MQDTRINYAALGISIITNCLPEWAFERVYGDLLGKVKMTADMASNADVGAIRGLREEGFTYREIGEMYGVKDEVIYLFMNRRKKKLGVT